MAYNRFHSTGLAALAVFLLGLLIVGDTSVRLAVLGLTGFVVALAISPTASRRALIAAIAAAICSAVVAYHAFSCEKTGKARYHHWGASRGGDWYEPVTREGSPTKYRQATNNTWALSLFLLIVSGAFYSLHRKLESSEDFP